MPGLILKGNLKVGTNSGNAVEVGAEVTHFQLTAAVDQIEVPETMGSAKTTRAGANDYTIGIGYLADPATGSLFRKLWDGAESATGTLYFEGSLRDESYSASNLKWSGVMVVTEASIGGDAEGLATGSATYPLTAAPATATS